MQRKRTPKTLPNDSSMGLQIAPMAIVVLIALVMAISMSYFDTANSDRFQQGQVSAERKLNLISSAVEPIARRNDRELITNLLVNFSKEGRLAHISAWLLEDSVIINSDGTVDKVESDHSGPTWFHDQSLGFDLVKRSAVLHSANGEVIGKAYLGYKPEFARSDMRSASELVAISLMMMLLFVICIPVASITATSIKTMKLGFDEPEWMSPLKALLRPFQKEDTALEAEFRISQMTVIVGQMGFNMALNLFNVVTLCAISVGQVNDYVLATWAIVTLALISFGVRTYLKFKNKPKPASVSKKALKRIALSSALLGTLWAIGIILFFPHLSQTSQLIIMVMITGIISGGAILMAPIPSAAVGFTGTVLIGTTVSAAAIPDSTNLILVFAAIFLAAAKLTISFIKYRHFVKTTIAQQAQIEQEKTIKLLLNDFEDTSSDWLWSIDSEGFLERVPDAMLKALNAEDIEEDHRHLPDILRRLDSEDANNIAQSLENREILRNCILRVPHANGSVQWLSISARASEESGEDINGVAEDITKQYEAEIALGEHAKKLEAAVQELEQFAFVASHDLKEPLRKIEAFGSRLEKRFGDELGETGAQYIDRMTDASTRMRKLIDDLLEFSRISTRGAAFAPVDMNAVMANIKSDLQIVLEEKQGVINCEELPNVIGDYTQLRRMLQNLVSNSLKFSKPDVAPSIDISVRENTDSWELSVRDNGIGFDPKETESIFKIFHRLHGRSEYEGTGIGLSAVKKIVDRHEGMIRAESESGAGSTFIVTLPKQQKNVETPDLKLAA